MLSDELVMNPLGRKDSRNSGDAQRRMNVSPLAHGRGQDAQHERGKLPAR